MYHPTLSRTHEIDGVPRWFCPELSQPGPILLIPPVDCVPRSSPDAPMQQIEDRDVRPHCRGHADCSALPFGQMPGRELEAKCVYPSAPPSPCSSQSECRALPLAGRRVRPSRPEQHALLLSEWTVRESGSNAVCGDFARVVRLRRRLHHRAFRFVPEAYSPRSLRGSGVPLSMAIAVPGDGVPVRGPPMLAYRLTA